MSAGERSARHRKLKGPSCAWGGSTGFCLPNFSGCGLRRLVKSAGQPGCKACHVDCDQLVASQPCHCSTKRSAAETRRAVHEGW